MTGMFNPELVRQIQTRIATTPEADPQDLSWLCQIIREEAGVASDADVFSLLKALRQQDQGMGLLEQVLAIAGVTDVVVNGPDQIFFDRGCGLQRAGLEFSSDEEVRNLAVRLASSAGGRLDAASPFFNGRLQRADGSHLRIHAVLSPPADGGTCLSIRVLKSANFSLPQLVAAGTMDDERAALLERLVLAREAFLIIGGTGSGKTTLLSALLGLVPADQRIICVEDTAELAPQHPHVVSLISRTANVEGAGSITLADLIKQTLRMRPDRIVVGEIRGAEIADLLGALNTGHDGGAGTIHANKLEEVPARIAALAALAGMDERSAAHQFCAAIKVVLAMRRTSSGRQLQAIGRVHLSDNQMVVTPVWTSQAGALPGYSELVAEVNAPC